MSNIGWPTAALRPLARARALAAGIPGAGLAETTFDLPFEEAWPRLMDLERSVPASDRLVGSIEVRDRERLGDGSERLRISTRSSFGLPQPFDVRVEDGFCLMRAAARLYVVVMAAEPDPADAARTRYAHVEAVPRTVGRPLRRIMERVVADDVKGFARYLEGR